MAIAYCAFSHAQEQRMIYADLTMTKADTVCVDLSSTCEAYQKLVLYRKNGEYIHFKKIYFAIFDDHNSRKKHNPEGNFMPFKREFE